MPAPEDRETLLQIIEQSGLFDAAWYLRINHDVASAGLEPLGHFVDFGLDEQRWPNRFFDPTWYSLENDDVAAAGTHPLLHYLQDGEREGRRPHPLFDPVWYRTAYGVADGHLALAHYLAQRSSGRVVPNPSLFAVPLTEPYRDDIALGIDPVAHYLDDCEAVEREPFPDLDLVRVTGLVDENYYLISAADVHEAEAEPATHYCRWGWREYRKPNIYFDPVWYEQTNPDVARLQINPLVHYILLGEKTNRRPVPFFDPTWYRTAYGIHDTELALSHYLANRRRQMFSPTPLFDVKWYLERFGAEIGPNRDPFAHYLHAGMTRDIDPSPGFDIASYRRTHLGRPSRGFLRALRPDRHHPLVHYLRMQYASQGWGA